MSRSKVSAILPAATITAAAANQLSSTLVLAAVPRSLGVEFVFTYGSGGTSVNAYLQTSFDGGATWVDVAQLSVTTTAATKMYNLCSATPVTTAYTPTDGSLTANTCKDGLLSTHYRVKYTSVGTYAGGTSLAVFIAASNSSGVMLRTATCCHVSMPVPDE